MPARAEETTEVRGLGRRFPSLPSAAIDLGHFSMRLQPFLRQPDHITLAAITQLALCPRERNPKRFFYLDPHCRTHIVDRAGLVAQQVKAHNLENALLISPSTNIYISDIGEFGKQGPLDSGFFADLAYSSVLGLFARI